MTVSGSNSKLFMLSSCLLFGLSYGAPDCNHYDWYPANQCGSYNLELGTSVGYYCVAGNPDIIEKRTFEGTGCDSERLALTEAMDCLSDPGCNCLSENECESVEQSYSVCPGDVVVETQTSIINECLLDVFQAGNDRSYINECNENGQLVFKYYRESSDCSGDSPLIDIYESSCEDGGEAAFSSTCCEYQYESAGYDEQGTFIYNGGCSEHFSSLIYQDQTGTMSYSECAALCADNDKCESYSFGRPGVSRANWCNLYNTVCTDNDNGADDWTDWYMFIPLTGASWKYSGECPQHFDAPVRLLGRDEAMSLNDCSAACNEWTMCKSFLFRSEGSLCNLYSLECTSNDSEGVQISDVYVPAITRNAEAICNL